MGIRKYLSRTLGYFVAFVALGMATAALGPALPYLAQHTGSPINEISFLFTAHALGYLLGSFQGGRLYDRVPGHCLIAAALITMGAMLALVPLMPLLWALAVVMLLLGAAGGALDVGGNTLLVWAHGRRVGPYMNGLHFCFGVGSFLAPLILAQAISLSGDVTWGYWILALGTLPAAVWLLRFPSPKAQTASDGDDPGDPPASPQAGAAIARARRRERVLVLLIAALLLLYVGAETSFGGWVFTYAVDRDLAGGAAAAYLTSAFWGALTLGRLLAIPLAARIRPAPILYGDLAGCLASMAVILLWPDSALALWIGSIGLGLGMASIFPTAISLAERHLRITGRITGWFLVGASVGAMSLPWLIGQVFEASGPLVTMWVIAGCLVLTLGVLLAWTVYTAPVDRTPQTGV